MNVPYMKIFVYILTFVTYSYSGYGSSVLATLRDAVLSAETAFGDVMQNVIKAFEKFDTVQEILEAAVEEKCIFTCPEGGKPKKNNKHVPSADGCGSFGLSFGKDFLPLADMTRCCNEHDICYDTCNNLKEDCDVEFKRCLLRYCNEKALHLGVDLVKTCKSASNILYGGTMALGCKAYKDAQAKACYCPQVLKIDTKKKKYTRGDEL